MRGSIAVRVNDGEVDRFVTQWTRDLSFRKTAPGGHHSASMRLLLPRDTFRDLGPADKVYIYDARTTRTIWQGYTENPGATDGPQGEGFDLSVLGGQILASDTSMAFVYVDRRFAGWRLAYRRNPAFNGAVASRPDTDVEALMLTVSRDTAVTTGDESNMSYELLRDSGLLLGGINYTWDAGIIDANYELRARSQNAGGTWTVLAQHPLNTAGGDPAAISAGGGVMPTDGVIANVMLRRVAGGATNVTTDNLWAAVMDLRVSMLRYTKDGAAVTGAGAYTNDYVLASEVVADLVGRGALSEVDPATAIVEATTAQIDQLAYPDGANAAQVFTDLALHEPDFLWEILEETAGGKHRFRFRQWPTTPRYEISVRDGYSAPGGETDLCNRIAVYWQDARGSKRTTIVTADVRELGGDPASPGFAGRIRDADAVTLPDGRGSEANAQRIGEQVLASKNQPARAARAVVRRPILDHLTGSTVMPWEIEPGYVVRVRELGEDLRLTEMEYADRDCAATLTLGQPTLTLEQMVAGLRAV